MPTFTQSEFVESSALLPPLLWQHFTDDDGKEDPFIRQLPLGYRDAWLIRWDQKDNPYGLLPQGALDVPPTLMQMPGRKIFEVEPGVYRGHTQILESELTKSVEPGTLADAVNVENRLADVWLYFGDMLANRVYKIYADLGVNGQIVNIDAQGNRHTYQIQNYSKLNVSGWLSDPLNATPIDDLRAGAQTLGRGTSTRYGQKSQLLMADEGVSALLATAQVRNAFRSNYGASFMAPFDHAQKTGPQPPLSGDKSLNNLFFGMGLPEIVPWNRGYYANFADARDKTRANFTKLLTSTQAVWLGYRPQGAQVGQLSFARHAGLLETGGADYGIVNVQRPGSLTEFGQGVYVRVHYHNEQPHHYRFEIGCNICPEVWYEDAMAAVLWS